MITKKLLFTLLITSTFLIARVGFEYEGISVKIVDTKGKIYHTIVKRDIPNICKRVLISNNMLWTGNYANEKVPKACKSTYVHTTGKLLPMQLHEEIITYGELEVLAFIKQMQTDDNMLLIDGRGDQWYNFRTIPGAVSMPHYHFRERKDFEFEFLDHLKVLGVKVLKNNTLDFKEAKILTIFCNGPWCSQSVWMIESLINIGYPADKISWYRGGMQTWLAAGLTSTKN